MIDRQAPTVAGGATARARLDLEFFEQPAVQLSKSILGCIMVKPVGNCLRRARIVEVEAYLGPADLASHSSKGRTPRTEVMFGPPGRAYVYFVYGMHWLFNIVCGQEGRANAVLIRAADPLDGWNATLTGPARLTAAFGITGAENRMDLCRGSVEFFSEPDYRPRIVRTPRIGVDYAGDWKDRHLRFVDVRNPVARNLRGIPKKTFGDFAPR